jgi:tetratricopeptide (TPR) repeat protein
MRQKSRPAFAGLPALRGHEDFRLIRIPAIIVLSASLVWAADSNVKSLIAAGEFEQGYNLLLQRPDLYDVDEQSLYYLGLTAPTGKSQSLYLKEYVQKYPDGDYIDEVTNLMRDYYAAQGLNITASRLYPKLPGMTSSNQTDLLKIAFCKQKAGEYDAAVEIYKSLIDEGSGQPAIWARLGVADCSMLKGDYEAAAVGYKDFIGMYPDSPAVAFALLGAADAYARLGQADRAKYFNDQYIKSFPGATAPSEAEPPVPEEEATPARLPKSINAAYFIQVGVFGKIENARTCLRKYRNLGYQVRMDEFQEGGQEFHKVLVGPYKDEASAQRVKNELEKSEGEKFLISVE